MTIENTFERDFQDIDTAIKELKMLGFSLDETFSQERYRVVPIDPPEDYPTMINSKRPLAVAFVTVHGRLIINEPLDKNEVLIEYRERLKEGLTERMKR